ncbi:MAG: hypothetical protein K1X55_04895 [Chitinophagales bacterium]|nr:hypothetical protein [Chitinophagales bacterium]
MPKEFNIWCDESVRKGDYYSNFYGGLLILSKDKEHVIRELNKVVEKIGIKEEIKWGKVDEVKLPAFIALMDAFFKLVEKNKIKVRIMFTQNAKVAKGLSQQHLENEYFLLYYQFFKHSFGFRHSNLTVNPIYIRAHFDYMPDTISKKQQFKEYIKGLESTKDFIDAKLNIRKQDIVEINSKEHLPLQFLDVVLGAMQFRLNNKHKLKPDGKHRRGKKTIAKEKLFKHVLKRIQEIRPGFNIGISTGYDDETEKWTQPYRHWCFIPKEFEIDKSKFK